MKFASNFKSVFGKLTTFFILPFSQYIETLSFAPNNLSSEYLCKKYPFVYIVVLMPFSLFIIKTTRKLLILIRR